MSQNNTFEFVIFTPEGSVIKSSVESVSLTLEGGDIQCLPNHASLTGSVEFSPVILKMKEGSETYMVRNGIFLFDNKSNRASLLVLSSEKKSEMSLETVKEYHDFIVERLKKGDDLSDFQIKYLEGEKVAVEKQLEIVGSLE